MANARKRANREGSVFKRKDGRWVAQLWIAGKARCLYAPKDENTRERAHAMLVAAQADLQRGIRPSDGRQTVAEYLEHWLEAVARPRVRPLTFVSYELQTRRLVPLIGQTRMAKLTPQSVQEAYGRLQADGLSPRSVEFAHAVLRAALKDAVRQGIVARNVTDAVKAPRPVRKEMKVLSAEQARGLIETTRQDRFGPLWALLVTSGLRIGEALGLSWQDVDLDRSRLVVRRTLQSVKGTGLMLAEPKTGRSRRTVHLSAVAVEALREQRRRQAAERLAAGPSWQQEAPEALRGVPLVFTKADGALRHPYSMREPLLEALRRAGLPAIRVHDLRHSCATILLSCGSHPKIVSELLGHSTVSLTLDVYSAYVPAMHEDAARQMDVALGAMP